MKRKNRSQVPARLGFLIYCGLMLWLLFGQRIGENFSGDYIGQLAENRNLIPLATIGLYLRLIQQGRFLQHAFVNLVGNVVMFIPLGYLLPRIWKPMGRFFLFLLTMIGVIVWIELTQYFTLLGSCDVDDLILNLSGAILGYLFFFFSFAKKA